MPSLSLSTRFSRPRSASTREQVQSPLFPWLSVEHSDYLSQPPVPLKSPVSLEQAGPSSHSVSVINGRMAKGLKEAEYSDEGGDELILSRSKPLRQSSTVLSSEPQSPMIRGSSPPKRSFSFTRPRRSHTVKATSGPRSTATPETGSRSLLSRGRNSMLSKAILNNPPPRVVSAPTISGSPRGSPHSVPVDDDRELDMLREAAARSIGIASMDGNSLSNQVSFGDSSGEARAVRQRNGAVRFQEPGVSGVRSESPSMNSEPLPPFPCLLSSLKPHIRCTSAVSKYCAPPPFVSFLGPNKGSTRHWKSRHLVLTSVTYPATNSAPDERVYMRTDYLHLFKGSFPDDKEVDRLLLTDHSAAVLPNERDNLGDRQCLVKVNGYNAKGIKQDERGALILQSEVVWYFQCPDIQAMQKWLVSIRDAILNYRYWRTDPTKRPGAPTAPMTVRSRLERALTPDILGGDYVPSDDESQTVPVFRPHTSLGVHTNTSKPRGLRGLFINTQHNLSSPSTPGASRTVSPSRPSVSSSFNPPSPSAEGTRLSLTGSTPEVSQDLSLTSVDEGSVSFSFEGVPHTKSRAITPVSTSGSLSIMAREGRASSEASSKDTMITASKPDTANSTMLPEAQVASVAVPAHLLVGVPITPAEEKPPDSSLGMNGAKRNRLMNPRTFYPSTNPIEGDREREDFQRFLASPSYNPSILGPSLLRGMTQAISLSLPPPPRSRRATTSGGLSHLSTGSGRASPSLVPLRSRGSLDMSPTADASDLGRHKTSSIGRTDGESKMSDSCAGPVDFSMSPRSVRLSPPGIDDSSPHSGTGGNQHQGSNPNDTSVSDTLHHRRNSGQENRPRHSSSPSIHRNRLSSLPKMMPQGPTTEILVASGDTVVYNPSNRSIPPWRQTQISPVPRLRSLSQGKTGTYFAPGPDSIRMSSSHSVHSFQSHTTNISNEGSITPISTSPAQSYPSPYIHPDATTSSHSFGIRERHDDSVSLAGDQADQCYGSPSPGDDMTFRRPNHASLHSGSPPNKYDVSTLRARAASIPALTGSRTPHDSFPSFTPFWSTVESRPKLPPNSTQPLSYPAPLSPRSPLREDEDFLDLSSTSSELPTGAANSASSLPQFPSHPFPSVQFPYDRIDVNEISDGPPR